MMGMKISKNEKKCQKALLIRMGSEKSYVVLKKAMISIAVINFQKFRNNKF